MLTLIWVSRGGKGLLGKYGGSSTSSGSVCSRDINLNHVTAAELTDWWVTSPKPSQLLEPNILSVLYSTQFWYCLLSWMTLNGGGHRGPPLGWGIFHTSGTVCSLPLICFLELPQFLAYIYPVCQLFCLIFSWTKLFYVYGQNVFSAKKLNCWFSRM